MIRHIVMWKLKDKTEDGTKAENAAAIKAGLEGLVGKIDGLLKAEVMVGMPGGMDLCLYSELTDAAALEAGDTLHIRFAKGAANCRVTDTEEEA